MRTRQQTDESFVFDFYPVAVVFVLAAVVFALFRSTSVYADAQAKYVQSYVGLGGHVNREIAEKIALSSKGDVIRIALYLTARKNLEKNAPLHKAIKTALQNGAIVYLVTEMKNLAPGEVTDGRIERTKAYQSALVDFAREVRAAGPRSAPENFYLTQCYYGCISSFNVPSPVGINHHKIFMIQRASGKKILIQSSANDHDAGDNLYEQAISFDANFYSNIWAQYLTRFEQMRKVSMRGDSTIGVSMPTIYREVSAFIGPYSAVDQSKGLDVYMNLFDSIGPQGKGQCEISVVMGHWRNGTRGFALLDRLNSLSNSGCKVRAVFGGDYCLSDQIAARAKFLIKYNDKVHAKFVNLQFLGTLNGVAAIRKLVYAGSHNFYSGAIKYDDDAVVRVDRPEIYTDFNQYFQKIFSEPETAPPACS